MIHTAELTTAITQKEYNFLQKLTKDKTGKIYTLSQKGITRIVPIKTTRDFEYFSCKIVINLNRIANHGERTAAPFTESEENLKRLYDNFKEFMGKLLPYRADINCWTVQRIDYTRDIKTPYCAEYIELLQRGNKPSRLRIDSKDTHKKEIDKKHYKGSVRYRCKGYTVNIYDKYKERIDKNITREIAEESKNILRIEIQCNPSKIDYISKKNGIYGQTIESLAYLQAEQENMIKRAIKAIEGSGDYYTLKGAIDKVEKSTKKTTTKSDMTRLLQIVNQYRSVRKARANFRDIERFNRLIEHLQELNINPVTIPKAWGIKTLSPVLEIIG